MFSRMMMISSSGGISIVHTNKSNQCVQNTSSDNMRWQRCDNSCYISSHLLFFFSSCLLDEVHCDNGKDCEIMYKEEEEEEFNSIFLFFVSGNASSSFSTFSFFVRRSSRRR
mmetsp:Transcript_26980/g.39460  ORF Transcript_26980/g.39460 Transcript_26980/m.39460 type:complete len:112 (+) Transcript_26980:747-1082(+)